MVKTRVRAIVLLGPWLCLRCLWGACGVCLWSSQAHTNHAGVLCTLFPTTCNIPYVCRRHTVSYIQSVFAVALT